MEIKSGGKVRVNEGEEIYTFDIPIYLSLSSFDKLTLQTIKVNNLRYTLSSTKFDIPIYPEAEVLSTHTKDELTGKVVLEKDSPNKVINLRVKSFSKQHVAIGEGSFSLNLTFAMASGQSFNQILDFSPDSISGEYIENRLYTKIFSNMVTLVAMLLFTVATVILIDWNNNVNEVFNKPDWLKQSYVAYAIGFIIMYAGKPTLQMLSALFSNYDKTLKIIRHPRLYFPPESANFFFSGIGRFFSFGIFILAVVAITFYQPVKLKMNLKQAGAQEFVYLIQDGDNLTPVNIMTFADVEIFNVDVAKVCVGMFSPSSKESFCVANLPVPFKNETANDMNKFNFITFSYRLEEFGDDVHKTKGTFKFDAGDFSGISAKYKDSGGVCNEQWKSHILNYVQNNKSASACSGYNINISYEGEKNEFIITKKTNVPVSL
jgi:hypothetical protein